MIVISVIGGVGDGRSWRGRLIWGGDRWAAGRAGGRREGRLADGLRAIAIWAGSGVARVVSVDEVVFQDARRWKMRQR